MRNLGFRVLDEPDSVSVVYNKQDGQVEIKWEDPIDITTFNPVPAEWAGTVVVRKEESVPLHRYGGKWGGTLLTDSHTRDQYKTNAYVDNTVEVNKRYYYGIFPYSIALDDEDHPIRHYRFTKVISVDTAVYLMAPTIESLEVNGTSVTVTYDIPEIDGLYSYCKLVVKKGGIPADVEDGDVILTLNESLTEIEVTGLDAESRYYFVIFTADTDGNTANSDSPDIVTGVDAGWNYDYTGQEEVFEAPTTGIFSLETWGAQGGNATDGTNVARGGYGAYAYGEVFLQEGDKLYINVGGQNGYGGGGSNLPIHNLETWQYRGNTVDMTLLTDFSQIPEAVKTATSHTSSRIYNQSASSRPSWLTMGDVLYEFTQNTSETNEYIFVDSDYIKIQFGKYQEDGNTYYGFAMFNKITGDRIDSYGDALTNNAVRDYYLGIVIDTPNQRAYLIVGNSKSNANYFRVDVHAFMYNGVDLLWETFKYC
jgi:hypothetical protein